jgi:hypothetical protein
LPVPTGVYGQVMGYRSIAALGTVALVCLLTSCAHPAPPPADPNASPTTIATSEPVQPAPLPDPQALVAVLEALTDPTVPGAQKLPLIENAGSNDVARLDSLDKALQDTQSLPLTFAVSDVMWSDRHPGDVRAAVNVVAPAPKGGLFGFPMEFTPTPGGWQLTRETADLLLAQGVAPPAGANSPPPAPAPPAPPPVPAPPAPPSPTPAR